MSFELHKGEDVSKGVRRIVCARIDNALKLLQRTSRTRGVTDRTVHEVRKRLKEIRAALRMVRSELGGKTYHKENRTFRDAARPLSELRDAKILVDSIDGLLEHFNGRLNAEQLAPVKRALQKRRSDVRKQIAGRADVVRSIVAEIGAARSRVKRWPLKKGGWGAIRAGVKKVYAKGVVAMHAARAKPADDELLHEWRKRAKDLRYELELLRPIWPEMFEPLASAAHQLTDLLGDDHDLAVLRAVISTELDASNPERAADIELLHALIDERRAGMQREAFELGAKIYEEAPDQFLERVRGYWHAARKAEPIRKATAPQR